MAIAEFIERRRVALLVGVPTGLYAVWISSMVVPVVARNVVVEVVRNLMAH